MSEFENHQIETPELKRIEVELFIEPRVRQEWKDFLKEKGENSIALDGRVIGPTRRDASLPAANFNHHEGVDRTSTSATCEQVLSEIRLGLFETFKKVKLYVEDCDEDVSTSVTLFRLCAEDPSLLENGKLDQLVSIENHLDMSAGMYPIKHDFDTLSQIRWVYEPYRKARREGKVPTMTAEEMEKIINEIGRRIKEFILDRAEKIELDGRYNLISKNEKWVMVEEVGNDARVKIVEDGIKAMVSVNEVYDEKTKETRWKYTFAKLSHWIKFPLVDLYAHLNEKEGIDVSSGDTWGGSDLSGGSPKESNSKISPNELEKIINEFLEKYYSNKKTD